MVMLVGASLLFLDFTGSVHAWLGWIAEIQFIPAVLALNLGAAIALVLLTLVTRRPHNPFRCGLSFLTIRFSKFFSYDHTTDGICRGG